MRRVFVSLAAYAMIAASGLPLLPTVGVAQQDSMRVTVIRAVTPFEVQVERLARQLVGQQQRVVMLDGRAQQLRVSLRTSSLAENQRAVLISRLRDVESELSSIGLSAVALRRELERLCAPTMVAEGWMGVAYKGEFTMDMTPGGMVMRVRSYPELESVEPKSPADKAGLRRGDVMLSMGGQELIDAVVDIGQLLKPGTRLPVRVKRGVDVRVFTVVIEPRPADFRPTCAWEDETIGRALAVAPNSFSFVIGGQVAPDAPNPFRIGSGQASGGTAFSSPEPPSGRMGFTLSSNGQFAGGAQLTALNEGLIALTGVERGIFVVTVARRSPAAQSGLKAGDVITAVEGRSVSAPTALLRLMESSESRELRLQVVRNRRTENVTLRW